jgi:hypothetical protein
MKQYKFVIPVTWSVSADMEIMAGSLEEAIQKANDYINLGQVPLPEGSEYIDGTFEVNDSIIDVLNDVVMEVIKIDKAKKEDYPLLLKEIETDKGRAYLEKKLKEG